MLILSRKVDERIIVTDDRTGETVLTMTLVAIRGDKVRTGWAALPHFRVHREEVQERIDEERKAVGA